MTTSEKVAYLKGLAEGMELTTGDSKEAKVLTAIIDILNDMALDMEDLGEELTELGEQVDEIDEDLADVEDLLYEDDEDEDDEDFEWDDDEDELDWDDDEEFEEGFDFGDEDSTIYEVECVCGEVINFDEETLEKGSIICPNCGESLEFSFEDEDEE